MPKQQTPEQLAFIQSCRTKKPWVKGRPLSNKTKEKISRKIKEKFQSDHAFKENHKEGVKNNGHKKPLCQELRDKIGDGVSLSKPSMSPQAKENQKMGMLMKNGIEIDPNHTTNHLGK